MEPTISNTTSKKQLKKFCLKNKSENELFENENEK